MMNVTTGKSMIEEEHILQSIYDIILTPKGETILNREYGSNVYKYLDQPINQVASSLGAEIISSLNQFELRIKVKKVKLNIINKGGINIDIELQNGSSLKINTNNKEEVA